MKYRALSTNSQSSLKVQGIQGSPAASFMAVRALVMIGFSVEEEEIFFAGATLMAWIWKYRSFPFRRVISLLSSLVLTSSFLERVSAGPILIPHSTPHLMSYSYRNNHHLACQ